MAYYNGTMPSEAFGSQKAILVDQLSLLEASLVTLQGKTSVNNELVSQVWRLSGSTFVFLMQLGFSLLEAGTVRFKNTRNIMIKNVLDTCISAIAFWLIGYTLAFGDGSLIFGWTMPDGQTGFARVYDAVHFFYAFVFCATSATIFAGAVAERTHLAAYLLFNMVLAAVIYPVVAHTLWSDYGLLSPLRGGNVLNTNGVLDNAGSMVVHVTGGVTSLVGAWMVGPRIGRFDIDGKVVPFKGHSMVFIAAGTIILWTGFFGFNGGSVDYHPNENAINWVMEVARVCVNTTVSAAMAGGTVFTLTFRRKQPAPEDTFNGVIGGLVAACATSSIVEPYAAAVIGIVAGCFYLLGVWVLEKLRIDDPVQATAVHLFCGSWGGIAPGFFATPWGVAKTYDLAQPLSCGVFYGCSGWQLLVQILGLLWVYVWVGAISFVLFYVLHYFNVLRVKRHEEEVGLDIAFHGGIEVDDDRLLDSERTEHSARRFSRWRWTGRRPSSSAAVLEQPLPQNAGFFTRLGAVTHSLLTGSRTKNRAKLFTSSQEPLAPDNQPSSSPLNVPAAAAMAEAFGATRTRRDVWHRALENTAFGQLSLAMYEANYVMEDAVEVEVGSSGIFIGVHDGHCGSEAAEFLRHSLYDNLAREFLRGGVSVSEDAIRTAYSETDRRFMALVRDSFEDSPHLATVGACSATAIVTPTALWVANVGDCRAVLGQVRRHGDMLECRALQMSVDHNLTYDSVREAYMFENPDAVTEKRGRYRVKGKVTVTRAFGDLYLKSHEFNREPLHTKFRVPEPFHPPLVTAEPHIAVRMLAPHDTFLVVASDGLFELMTNQEVVDLVASSPRKDIARQLIRFALHRAAEKTEVPYPDLLRMPPGQRRDYHDDITVVVFFFDHEAMKRQSQKNNVWKREKSLKGGVSMDDEGPPSGDFHIIASTHGSRHGSQRGEGSRHLNGSNRGVENRSLHGELDGSKHMNKSSRGVEGSQTLTDIKEL